MQPRARAHQWPRTHSPCLLFSVFSWWRRVTRKKSPCMRVAQSQSEGERENSSVEIPHMQTAPYNLHVRWFKKSQSMNYSKVISNTSTTSLGLGWLRFWSNPTTIEQTVTFASLLCYLNWNCFVFATFQANHHKKLNLAFFLIGLGNVFHLTSLYKAGHILGAPGTFLEFCQSLFQWWNLSS